MTQNELDKYIELQEKFQLRCEAICKILKPLNNHYEYLSYFEIVEDEIHGNGDEYWGYGGHESHFSTFPLKFICAPDEEIEKYVSDTLAERERKLKLINDVKEIEKLKKEKEEYERLKKKFEGK